MAKLTKDETKQFERVHDMVMSASGPLSQEDRREVFLHWHPGATNLNVKTAAFFTPPDLADDLVMYSIPDGEHVTVVDLCAGIGVLANAVLKSGFYNAHRTIERLVCVELNPDYVEIGRRLVPEAEWYCADIFNGAFWQQEQFAGGFTVAVSNPPFLRLTKKARQAHYDWLSYYGKTDLMAVEVALRLCPEFGGGFILPSMSCPFMYSGNRDQFGEASYKDRGPDDCKDFVKLMKALSPKALFQDDSRPCIPDISLMVAQDISQSAFSGVAPAVELCNVEYVYPGETAIYEAVFGGQAV